MCHQRHKRRLSLHKLHHRLPPSIQIALYICLAHDTPLLSPGSNFTIHTHTRIRVNLLIARFR